MGCKCCGREHTHSEDCFVPMRIRFIEAKKYLADAESRLAAALAIVEELEREVGSTMAHRRARSGGGMAPVTDTSDFSSAAPSSLRSIGVWAARIRAALKGETV